MSFSDKATLNALQRVLHEQGIGVDGEAADKLYGDMLERTATALDLTLPTDKNMPLPEPLTRLFMVATAARMLFHITRATYMRYGPEIEGPIQDNFAAFLMFPAIAHTLSHVPGLTDSRVDEVLRALEPFITAPVVDGPTLQ